MMAIFNRICTLCVTVAKQSNDLDINDEKIIKQFEKTYKHHIDVIDINMSGICEKCLEKKGSLIAVFLIYFRWIINTWSF